jgi:hypothetical protein
LFNTKFFNFFRKYVAGAEFNAQPVIFVPGNAGSGQEIGAFWHFLRWKGVESSVDFDLFALDFNGVCPFFNIRKMLYFIGISVRLMPKK